MIIDSTYRGEVIAAVHNDTNEEKMINAGERFCQLIVQPYLKVDLEVVKELSETERGEGGFGHSGKF